MSIKFISVLFGAALLISPGSFGSTAISQDIPLIEPEDVESLGDYEVVIIRGVSAKRLWNVFGSMILVDHDGKLIAFLKFEV